MLLVKLIKKSKENQLQIKTIINRVVIDCTMVNRYLLERHFITVSNELCLSKFCIVICKL